MIKVCYITSKDFNDTRVFSKECLSLKDSGYDVTILCTSKDSFDFKGIHIKGISYLKRNFYSRNIVLPKLFYRAALDLNADIYHFNDPCFMRFVSKLKKHYKKVIFDSFEDHPTLLFEKKRMPRILIKLLSYMYSLYEKKKCKEIDGVICCYHWTYERLKVINNNIELVFNFPIIETETKYHFLKWNERSSGCVLCYPGLISHIWNLDKILKILSMSSATSFNIAGWGDLNLLETYKKIEGWKLVNFMGKLDKNDVIDKVYNKSNIGVALLDYLPLCKFRKGNLSNNKLFEYMYAGLPVICTDFDLWKGIIQKYNCGICVNPFHENEILDAINYLNSNRDIADEMGKNGHNLVVNQYNWSTQKDKLFKVYKNLYL